MCPWMCGKPRNYRSPRPRLFPIVQKQKNRRARLFFWPRRTPKRRVSHGGVMFRNVGGSEKARDEQKRLNICMFVFFFFFGAGFFARFIYLFIYFSFLLHSLVLFPDGAEGLKEQCVLYSAYKRSLNANVQEHVCVNVSANTPSNVIGSFPPGHFLFLLP